MFYIISFPPEFRILGHIAPGTSAILVKPAELIIVTEAEDQQAKSLGLSEQLIVFQLMVLN